MSDFSLTLVLRLKTSKIINGMAKVSIKSERITPFGGIFHVRELFSRFVGPVIDKVLGLRCTSFGYQYSEIAGSLASVYFCYREPRRPLGPRDALQAKNANVRFHQQDTLERIFSNLESEDIHIRRARMDCGSCSRKIVETVDGVRGNWA